MIFDPLSAASLLVLAAAGEGLCTLPQPTEIQAKPSSKSIEYDYSQSLSDLQRVRTDTIDPHSFNGISMTQGYMDGAIKLVPKVDLNYKVYTGYKAACIWYDKIRITIEINPRIIIAKEVHDDRCMGDVVAEHEMKHVKIDREIVNKYAQIMGSEVYDALKERGFIAGPIPSDSVESIAARMQKVVYQVVEHEYKKMDLEREEKQRDVDNIDEYKRVQSLCPDFNPVINTR